MQLYIKDLVASVTRPVKELKGFSKILLKTGEKKVVKFVITENDLSFYDSKMNYTAEPGEFMLWISTSSADEKNTIGFKLDN